MPIRKPTPEESELIRRRAELEDLRTSLAERELERIDVKDVGALRSDLDEWQARIAELTAQLHPSSAATAQAAAARQRARESHEQTRDRSPEVKQLYVDVVKALHPEFARTAADRDRRTQTMVETNRAYQADDTQALRRASEEYRAGTEDLPGEPIKIELDRLAREISMAKARMSTIERELADLGQSDRTAAVRQQIESAKAEFEKLSKRNKST